MVLTLAILSSVLGILNFYLMFKINKYLNNKIEPLIDDCIEKTENLEQTFRTVLVEETFLLKDNKLKKLPIETEQETIVNGIKPRV